jgi:hypothetical protein
VTAAIESVTTAIKAASDETTSPDHSTGRYRCIR